jgi:hypothetical protein
MRALSYLGQSAIPIRTLLSPRVVEVDQDFFDALRGLKGSRVPLGVGRLLCGFLPDDCEFLRADDRRGELAALHLALVGMLERGADSDNPMRARHVELELCVVGDGHQLRVARPPQDGVVGSVKSDHLEGEGLRPIVGWIPGCYG